MNAAELRKNPSKLIPSFLRTIQETNEAGLFVLHFSQGITELNSPKV
jgi:hypothetical protein